MAQTVSLSELRSCQEKAYKDESYAKDLLGRLSADKRGDNLKAGYYGVIKAMMAEHTYNPFRKMSYFNEGKKQLEQSIKNDSNSVELRFLRLGIQMNVPDFLGYKSAISKDKTFIVNHIEAQKSDLGELYNEIIDYVLELKECSEEERAKLLNL